MNCGSNLEACECAFPFRMLDARPERYRASQVLSDTTGGRRVTPQARAGPWHHSGTNWPIRAEPAMSDDERGANIAMA